MVIVDITDNCLKHILQKIAYNEVTAVSICSPIYVFSL